MKFYQPTAHLFIPDTSPEETALARTTHLGISAHQDDLEIMAVHAILTCFQQPHQWFTGVVETDGRGSPRSGLYENYTNDQMQAIRVVEQKKASLIGDFSALALLDYPSRMIKDRREQAPVQDLLQILKATLPQFVYTHNLADKHETHVGAALKVIDALRQLPPAERPEKVYGCEVWRDLDWMNDDDKVVFDVSANENLQAALLGVYDSQISGGKRYDLAAMGRRRANATYFASHGVDTATGLAFAMDLTPLVEDPLMDIADYVDGYIEHFRQSVLTRLL